MVTRLIALISFLPKILLRVISHLFPRKKNLWLFGSWEGKSFADNAKYFYLHIIKTQPHINAVWFTRNEKTLKEVLSYGGKAVLWPSPEAFWHMIRAKFFFSTHASYDFIPELMGGSTHVELFHATFPLKRMGYDEGNFNPTSKAAKFKRRIFQPFIYSKAAHSIASSPVNQKIFSSCLQIPSEKIWLTGFPRSDALWEKSDYILAEEKKVEDIFKLNRFSFFIYLVPTFRNAPEFSLFQFSFEVEKLLAFLESINGILIIRMHPFEMSRAARYIDIKSERILFENHGLSDPYPLLKRADVLITDFSSIYADYLLLDRPVVFAKFAFEQYVSKERNLYWNYDDVAPGEKASNWPELIECLIKISIEKQDNFKIERKNLREKIFAGNERNSCSKILEHLNNL